METATSSPWKSAQAQRGRLTKGRLGRGEFGSSRRRFKDDPGSVRGRINVVSGRCWGRCRIDAGWAWGQPGVGLGSFRDGSGVGVWGGLLARSGVDRGRCRGSFRGRSGVGRYLVIGTPCSRSTSEHAHRHNRPRPLTVFAGVGLEGERTKHSTLHPSVPTAIPLVPTNLRLWSEVENQVYQAASGGRPGVANDRRIVAVPSVAPE